LNGAPALRGGTTNRGKKPTTVPTRTAAPARARNTSTSVTSTREDPERTDERSPRRNDAKKDSREPNACAQHRQEGACHAMPAEDYRNLGRRCRVFPGPSLLSRTCARPAQVPLPPPHGPKFALRFRRQLREGACVRFAPPVLAVLGRRPKLKYSNKPQEAARCLAFKIPARAFSTKYVPLVVTPYLKSFSLKDRNSCIVDI
jgi:hypothetical protein